MDGRKEMLTLLRSFPVSAIRSFICDNQEHWPGLEHAIPEGPISRGEFTSSVVAALRRRSPAREDGSRELVTRFRELLQAEGPKYSPDYISQEMLRDMLHSGALELPEDLGRRTPSRLLTAAYQVVPFWGRRAELDTLAAWCEQPETASVRLYTGPGGCGKTRMMVQAIKELGETGWTTGFIHNELAKPDEALDIITKAPSDRLIVIDYAETRRIWLGRLLVRMMQGTQGRIRVILLARTQGDWWRELRRQSGAVAGLLDASPDPVSLEPLFPTVAERPARFEAAARAFAEAQGWAFPGVPAHDGLQDDVLAQPLYLWMAALLSLLGKRFETTTDLLDETLAHEQRFWLRRLAAPPIRWELTERRVKRRLGPIVAGLTLLGGTRSEDETLTLIQRVGSLKGDADRDEDVADLLRDLYPAQSDAQGERWLIGLQPDVLGEHLVAQHLSEDLVVKMLAEEFDGIGSVLTILTRLANRAPDQRKWLVTAFADQHRLDRCALTAMEVAIESGDPIGRVLATQVSKTPPTDIKSLYDLCPHKTTSLMEFSKLICGLYLDTINTNVAFQTDLKISTRVKTMITYSDRLEANGNMVESLKVAEEACLLASRIASLNFNKHGALFAAAVGTKALRYRACGAPRKAIETMRNTILIYGRLPKDCLNDSFPDFVGSLTNMALMESEYGQLEQAEDIISIAVEACRELVELNPETFRSQLAGTLVNEGVIKQHAGKYTDSVCSFEESVSIYKDLATERPDSFSTDLATVLTNISGAYINIKKPHKGLSSIREAVSIVRKLATERPRLYMPRFIMAINNLLIAQASVGDLREAFSISAEVVTMCKSLIQDNPKDFAPIYSRALNNIALVQINYGDKIQAFFSIKTAIKTLLPLFERNPLVYRELMRILLHNYDLIDIGSQPCPAFILKAKSIQNTTINY